MKVDYVIICLAWEKLRLIYNAVLVILTVCLGTLLDLWARIDPEFFNLSILVLAVLANLLFFMGPATECMAYRRGMTSIHIRRVLFLGGTLTSMALAASTLYEFATTFRYYSMPF